MDFHITLSNAKVEVGEKSKPMYKVFTRAICYDEGNREQPFTDMFNTEEYEYIWNGTAYDSTVQVFLLGSPFETTMSANQLFSIKIDKEILQELIYKGNPYIQNNMTITTGDNFECVVVDVSEEFSRLMSIPRIIVLQQVATENGASKWGIDVRLHFLLEYFREYEELMKFLNEPHFTITCYNNYYSKLINVSE